MRPGAQADVDGHRAEDDPEEHAQDHRPRRELGDVRRVGDVGLERGGGGRRRPSRHGPCVPPLGCVGPAWSCRDRADRASARRGPASIDAPTLDPAVPAAAYTGAMRSARARPSVLRRAGLAPASPPSSAPAQGDSRYEAMYGTPVDVELDDLAPDPGSYDDRAVRTHGPARHRTAGIGARLLRLRDSFGDRGRASCPSARCATRVRATASAQGRSAGTVRGHRRASSQIAAERRHRPATAPGRRRTRSSSGASSARPRTTQAASSKAARDDARGAGRAARQARRPDSCAWWGSSAASNLYGDLPVQQPAHSRGLGHQGRRCTRSGSRARSRRARAGSWTPASSATPASGSRWSGGRRRAAASPTCRPIEVSLTDAAHARPPTSRPPPPPPERPRCRRWSSSRCPWTATREVPRRQPLRRPVQQGHGRGHVRRARCSLRYAGPRLPGDRAFDGVKLSYDGGRRALTVDPGDVLRAGRQRRAGAPARHRRRRRPHPRSRGPGAAIVHGRGRRARASAGRAP